MCAVLMLENTPNYSNKLGLKKQYMNALGTAIRRPTSLVVVGPSIIYDIRGCRCRVKPSWSPSVECHKLRCSRRQSIILYYLYIFYILDTCVHSDHIGNNSFWCTRIVNVCVPRVIKHDDDGCLRATRYLSLT